MKEATHKEGKGMESGNERSLRIDSNVERGRAVRITVDGEAIPAYEGESVAAAMLASGRRVFRHAEHDGPRGVFCGMGICNECMVTVADLGHVRACIATVRDGMRVSTQ
ncbi:MAG: (2Fe-2S)-binding protein [Candidatus Korobacteraceae bacterium]|jgi:sarcosine oxidase subunit alpha